MASPRLPGRELLSAAGVAVLLAAVMNVQILVHVADRVPVSLDDPLLQAWEIAWGGHALVHDPTGLFDTNAFWPLRDTLALSDSLLGYAPLGLIGGGVSAALVRYNLLQVLAFALAFMGAYVLARELGMSWRGALVAGVAFAYAPWRLSQANHLNVLSSGAIPLSLFLLLRGTRRRRPLTIFVGFLIATWQVSLGFVLGLPFLYLLAVVAAIGLVRWIRQGRPAVGRRTIAALSLGAIVLVSGAAVLSLPYLESGARYPESRRTRSEVTFFSAPKAAFFAAPEESFVWGAATRAVREDLPWENEHTLFPGVVISALAGLGALAGRLRVAVRIGLVVVAAVTAVLALGLRLASGALGYRLLYELAPGWDRIRVPARLFTFTTLALAMLAGAGADRLLTPFANATSARRAAVTGVLVAGLVLLDGAGWPPMVTVPPPPAGLRGLPAPLLHLPMSEPNLYMLWSTDGFPAIVNGHSGIVPAALQRAIEVSLKFPDRDSVAYFRDLGVHAVVFHPELAAGTAWSEVPERPVEGLSVCRRTVGRMTVFDLRSRC